MRKLLYSMQFRSRTSAAAGRSGLLRTAGSGASCVVSTTICPSGLLTGIQSSDTGGLAFFESELRVTGPEEFQENGSIMFGDDSEHLLRFSTVGQGHIDAGLEPGTMTGTASWRIDGGEGQFAAARGLITVAFTINGAGERCDFHCGLIFLTQ